MIKAVNIHSEDENLFIYNMTLSQMYLTILINCNFKIILKV